ncbi:MAG: HutD family protein [Planctomycetota bacterium]
MDPFVHLTPADARRVPWRNGRGVTEEIAIGPAGATFEAGDFAWRVARAGVVEDGPFSAFPGFERVLVVTEGAGLRLVHGGAPAVTLAPRVAHPFRGDDATSAALVAGPVRDLNVLARRGVCVADVEVVAAGPAQALALAPGVALVHAVGGAVVVTGAGGSVRLAAGDSLLAADLRAATTVRVNVADGACAIGVRVGWTAAAR